jgi:hypothetical protein
LSRNVVLRFAGNERQLKMSHAPSSQVRPSNDPEYGCSYT